MSVKQKDEKNILIICKSLVPGKFLQIVYILNTSLMYRLSLQIKDFFWQDISLGLPWSINIFPGSIIKNHSLIYLKSVTQHFKWSFGVINKLQSQWQSKFLKLCLKSLKYIYTLKYEYLKKKNKKKMSKLKSLIFYL